MNNSIMPKLNYLNPPVHRTYSSYRDYLRTMSNFSCSYCTIRENESPGATFQIDHFKPKIYFPQLITSCNNLRYSCPRCNSYKSNIWISEINGCNRKCEDCTNKVCLQNVERFIDSLIENPEEFITLGENSLLYAINNYNPAVYTIKYLRLNRSQLVKLRHIRNFLDSWEKELVERKVTTINLINSFETSKNNFIIKNKLEEENDTFTLIIIIYDLIIKQAESFLLFIDLEVTKLNYLNSI